MEPSTKLCISLCIFCPAFLYFIFATTGKAGNRTTSYLLPESDMIFVSQTMNPEERQKAVRLADRYNQNVWPHERNG
ncbi:hypothetical protein Q1695_001763 [Nippostrongylus brasiliensis]|nr:hypothetical protein Q1695_001763 [Nippostrongylus brasiliensis]